MRMRMRAVGVVVLAALLLAIPTAALAKGASAAAIRGPGLRAPIVLRGLGEPGTETRLAELASRAGLFAAIFGQVEEGQLLGDRPSGDLGPRYTVAYTIPVEDNGSVEVVQDVYPYAAGGPVSYTLPGQRLWAGQEVGAGWFRGPATLRTMLISLGLPKRAPKAGSTAVPARAPAARPNAKAKTASQAAVAVVAAPAAASRADTGAPAAWWAGGALLGAALLAGGLALVTLRRRRA
jgi:hypothetical protein